MPLEPNQSLSHYRLIEKIGEGGMGVVWKAVDTNLDREVAIKVLPQALASDPQRLERFEREAKLLASLNHSRIAALYGLHEAEGVRFLSMELIHGEDLAQRLTRGPVALEQALHIALQVAEGLEAAHESGIIHRDLKPANIQLTADSDVKILDFGLAKVLHDPLPGSGADLSQSPTMTAAATQAGVIMGTAEYMSPEQSRGRQADRRTDIWAFGCVLYEMLTGRGVFHGATASDCIAGILEREPDWEALPPGMPPAIRKLLRRCLEKDARRRLHDIADVRIEIEEAIAGGSAGEGAGVPEVRPAGGKGARITWSAAGLLLGVVVTALVVSRWMPPEMATPRSPGRFAVSLPPEAPVIPNAIHASVAISPGGTRLVYVGPEAGTAGPRGLGGARSSGSTRQTQLFTRRMDDYEVRAIDGTIGASSPFFSPDGEWVGFVDSRDGSLKKTRLRGGVPVVLWELPEGNIRGGSWGEDGRIYFGHGFGGLQAVPENGGTPETLTIPDRDRGEKTHRFPHVLPGGTGLLFTLATAGIASYDEASIALLDLRTGEHRVLLDGGTDPSYAATGHILYGRGGSLEAVPFDLESMQVTGAPFVVTDGVVTSDGWGSAHYTVSHGGTLAYVPGGPGGFQYSIYWLDRNGNLEAVPLSAREYGRAVFSPDGRRLAISILGANASIWVYEIERQTMDRLTTEWDNTNPIWMRSGSHVTFTSNRTGTQGLWRIAADGSGRPETLYAHDGIPGSWSVDDRWFAFSSSSPTTASNIWILSAEEELEAQPVLQTAFQEEFPVFSPDGRWLAYTSDATGQSQVYVQRFPVAGRKWQISADGGEFPLWSPDGRELYYQKGNRLMAVSVTTETDFAPGKERELLLPEFSNLLSWDIAPDGKRFVLVGRVARELKPATPSVAGEAAAVPEIRVVVDWFEELRRGPS